MHVFSCSTILCAYLQNSSIVSYLGMVRDCESIQHWGLFHPLRSLMSED
jgi:hypothetical protein